MTVWDWILIAAVVVIAVLAIIAARMLMSSRRTDRLKQQFGPEYDHAVGEAGEQRTAEKELVARERNRKKLDIVALPPEARANYTERWRSVQIDFVDNPSSAVGDADRLVTHVMRDRGYPIDDFDQRAADISVDHPDVVENYRAAHIVYQRQAQGDVGTEEMREAFVHYRKLFEKLLETDQETTKDKPKEARA
jgi:uncharacterized membrane protein